MQCGTFKWRAKPSHSAIVNGWDHLGRKACALLYSAHPRARVFQPAFRRLHKAKEDTQLFYTPGGARWWSQSWETVQMSPTSTRHGLSFCQPHLLINVIANDHKRWHTQNPLVWDVCVNPAMNSFLSPQTPMSHQSVWTWRLYVSTGRVQKVFLRK